MFTYLHFYIHIEALEQYRKAVNCYRTAARLIPDSATCNASWTAAQLKGFALTPKRNSSDPANRPYVEAYTPVGRSGYDLDTPEARVRLLPKPDNWPTRPAGGFTNDSEGFN